MYRTIHPSIVQTLPDDFPDLKHEFSKLESQMFDRPKKRAAEPLTPILPDAHDRIFTPGLALINHDFYFRTRTCLALSFLLCSYNYMPVHTEIYGTYRPRTARIS